MTLDALKNLRLWKTWAALGHEVGALDAINNSGLWLALATLGHELKAIDAINSLEKSIR